ncbi:MAG TPA: cytochrome d ubiquinol oxidase subunit II [Thermoleophilia bacterium]|nr:cytochrome d ubiquinol oxidase subunit II [Thermoleophilia bacterium]
MTLANIWFFLVALLLTVYVILDGFDLGAGVLYPFLGRSEDDKSVIRASIGPVWDGNEVWLLTGAGAIFAAFPMVYAMTFSGFYLAIMLVLFGLILRAVSLEFRHRDSAWAPVWDGAFFLGSLVPSLLVGVALGNVIRGVPMDAQGNYIGTFWDLLNPYSLLVGVTGLALLAQHGAAWLSIKAEGDLQERAWAWRKVSFWVCAVLAIATSVATIIAVPRASDLVFGRPAGWLFLAVAVIGILYTVYAMYRKSSALRSFVGSAIIIIGFAGIAAVGNFPDMVPARGTPPATSLTVERAASGHLTLLVMLILAVIFVPIVLVYTALIYRTFWGKTRAADADY